MRLWGERKENGCLCIMGYVSAQGKQSKCLLEGWRQTLDLVIQRKGQGLLRLTVGTSLVIQCEDSMLPMQETQVGSLVRELDPTCCN